ncbi:ABC transporter substrate-binding protein [Tessaracoccus sp.]
MLLPKGRKRTISALALVSGLALFAAGCGTPAAEKPSDGSSSKNPAAAARPLVIWAGSQTPIVANFNPYSPTVLHAALGPVYETLFAYNKAKAEPPTPMLGESFEYSEDGTELTIKIRQGVKWNDGKDFTAEDVVYSFMNENNKPGYLEAADVVDESTVKLTFNSPSFTNEVGIMGSTFMLPKHIWEGVTDALVWANAEPVGTGPYMVTATTDASYSLEANENYWQEGKPAVKSLQYIANDENTSAESLLKTGKVDYAAMFVPEPDALTADGRLGTINTPMDPTVLYTCSSVDMGCKGAQTDVAVRQALNVAINRGVIHEKAFVGLAGDISPTFALPGRDDKWVAEGMPATSPREADAAKAGEILEAAGYAKGGDGIYAKGADRVSMTLVSVSGWSDYNAAAELIAGQAKEAGIEVKAEMATWDGFAEARSTGNFELVMGGVVGTSVADPFQLYNDFFTTEKTAKVGAALEVGANGNWNIARYSNPVVDEAVRAAAATNDDAKKLEAYGIIQGEIVEDLPYIPLVINATQTFYDKESFDGWPTEDNLYAFPPAWGSVSAGVVLSSLTGK